MLSSRTYSGQGAGEAACLVDLVAKVVHRKPQLGDQTGDLGAEILDALTSPGIVALGCDIVGEVSQRDDSLGDAIVDVLERDGSAPQRSRGIARRRRAARSRAGSHARRRRALRRHH